ncbi:hypothetical protein [Acetonema longum]|uniref:Uncharacterized protein n=1 Tax=Acetonema longum DSM 6540 TaxID=1009370 RepID=F7NKB0_9FIRM|nr:hypothetical protein [Acetonema longum]EGO63551.1 hypothetical protein ALO_12616 [Acetonema longum DSM 6540]
MKTEREIRDEIEATQRAAQNCRRSYQNKKISQEVLKDMLIDCQATEDALRWVLGENDRYD